MASRREPFFSFSSFRLPRHLNDERADSLGDALQLFLVVVRGGVPDCVRKSAGASSISLLPWLMIVQFPVL